MRNPTHTNVPKIDNLSLMMMREGWPAPFEPYQKHSGSAGQGTFPRWIVPVATVMLVIALVFSASVLA